jgi:hypothetical protein
MATSVQIASYNPSLVIGTFGASGTLSEEFDLAGYATVGMLTDGMANGTMNILVAAYPLSTGTNFYRTLRDNVGVAVPLTIPTGNGAYKESDIRVIAPYRFVRLVSSVAQTGASATFVVK